MRPRGFAHGFHGVRHLRDADRPIRSAPDVAAPPRRPDLADLAVVVVAAVTAVAAITLAGCDEPERQPYTPAPRASTAVTDPLDASDFDITLLFDDALPEEFP